MSMDATQKPQTAPQRRQRVSRDDLPIVAIERPRCPACGSTNVRPKRSVTDDDGGVTRDTHCQEPNCRQRFFVVVD